VAGVAVEVANFCAVHDLLHIENIGAGNQHVWEKVTLKKLTA
jgi:hypothetical protein